ncbi:MAG TPA: hypothetical protein VFM93_03935 [Candidatus Limnocylindria bacterium]|nr:hypothetical protein [Candidatus Limnocylindria bacterium]
MDLIAALVYVLAVYVGLPLFALKRWSEAQAARDPAYTTRRRGEEKIRRELARRREGRIDAAD